MPEEIELIKKRVLDKLTANLPHKDLLITKTSKNNSVINNKRIFEIKQRVLDHMKKNLPAKELYIEH